MSIKVSVARLSVVLSLLALFASCTPGTPGTRIEYHKMKHGISAESYVDGKLSARQYFNSDTVPNGPLFRYSVDGKLEQWIWFKNGSKHFQVDYKNDSAVDLTGNPFLSAEQAKGKN